MLHFCYVFLGFRRDFLRFWEGLGRDFGRFFRGFLVIFSKCFENSDLAKNSVFPSRKPIKLRVGDMKNIGEIANKIDREFDLRSESDNST